MLLGADRGARAGTSGPHLLRLGGECSKVCSFASRACGAALHHARSCVVSGCAGGLQVFDIAFPRSLLLSFRLFLLLSSSLAVCMQMVAIFCLLSLLLSLAFSCSLLFSLAFSWSLLVSLALRCSLLLFFGLYGSFFCVMQSVGLPLV